jgi:hypothetical protein
MKMTDLVRAAVAVAALIAPLSSAQAFEPSMQGKWQIVEASPAPWSPSELRKELAAEGKHLLNLVVTFAPTSVSSKFKLLNCKSKVIYEANSLEVDALFQGNLPEPNPSAAAAHLGFPKGDIPGVDVRCVNETFTFHFRDPNTALININRVIYTFKRQ